MWIRVQGKARGGKKAQHTQQYVSILSRHVTLPWGLRRIFEMACNINSQPNRQAPYPDPPSFEFAGDLRRWVRRRTKVLQVPTNKEDPVKSADPKGQKKEGKNSLATNSPR